MIESSCDVLIVGGGTGGVAAAIAASSFGLRVVVAEQYEWFGGQLTSQGVPPDEHPWIETFGGTTLYRQFRKRVRVAYEQRYPLRASVLGTDFNPGGGFVSALCLEPRIASSVIDSMLEGPSSEIEITESDLSFTSGQRKGLRLIRGVVPVAADVESDLVRSVHLMNILTFDVEVISAAIVIDCTELGDLLPLTGTEYVSGSEAQLETDELHASEKANPDDVQGFTWCFAMGYDPKGEHQIEKPAKYDFWRSYRPQFNDNPWPNRLLDWTAVSPETLQARQFDLFANSDKPYNSLWEYRKIVSTAFLGIPGDDVTLVNWPQNDYFRQNIIDQPAETVTAALEDSRQLSLSLLYWLQTDAPRPDGGAGYPGLYLDGGTLGTTDGLAMAPYIRESRRIRALFTVTEAHVGAEMRAAMGYKTAEQFADSVGIGSYRIDLHPTPAGKNYVDISSLPFQIPLGSLIPVRMKNLLAGNKNIGVTHITNGCYRLHPVEWNIGEAVGHLAAYCITNRTQPHAVYENISLRSDYQKQLFEAGIELSWPEDIAMIPR